MSNISDYEVVASDNNDPPPNGAPEGWVAPQVNDTLREALARLARWWIDTNGSLITGGTGNNYTLTSEGNYQNLQDINILIFRADRANTGPATLNVDGLGNIDLRKTLDAALEANDIQADQIVSVVYNSQQGVFQLLSVDGGVLRGDFDISNLTQAEIDQIANINTTTISATQWGRLGGLDQSVASDAAVEFDSVALAFKIFGDVTDNGALFRAADGLYLVTSSTAALQWSSRNFTAGDGISVSYGSEDQPTLSVTSDVVRDSEIGTAAALDAGTGSSDVPQNSDLGSAAYEAVSAFLASSALTGSISQTNPDSDEVVSEEGIVNWGKVLGWGLRQSDNYGSTDVSAKNLLSGVYRATAGSGDAGLFPGNGVLLHLRGTNASSAGGEQFGLWFERGTNNVYARGYDNSADAHLPPERLLTEDDVGTGADQVPTNSDLSDQTCQARVTFDGEGGASITSSFNVSSVTRNNTGQYTVNFQTNLNNNNYTVVTGAGDPGPSSYMNGSHSYATSSFDIHTRGNDTSNSDAPVVTAAVFGGQ